jgi:hypothetical protein
LNLVGEQFRQRDKLRPARRRILAPTALEALNFAEWQLLLLWQLSKAFDVPKDSPMSFVVRWVDERRRGAILLAVRMGPALAVDRAHVPTEPANDEGVFGGQIFVVRRIDQRRNRLPIALLIETPEQFPFSSAKSDRSLFGTDIESGLEVFQGHRRQDCEMKIVAQGWLLTTATPLRRAIARRGN